MSAKGLMRAYEAMRGIVRLRLATSATGELTEGLCYLKLTFFQYRSIVLPVSGPRISAYRAATQTLLTWEL